MGLLSDLAEQVDTQSASGQPPQQASLLSDLAQEADPAYVPFEPSRNILRPFKEFGKALVGGIERIPGVPGTLAQFGAERATLGRTIQKVVRGIPGAGVVGEFLLRKHGPKKPVEFFDKRMKKIAGMGEKWADWFDEQANRGWEAPDPQVSRAKWSQAPFSKAGQAIGSGVPSYLTAIAASVLAKNPQVGLAILSTQSGATQFRQQRKKGTPTELAQAIGMLSGAWTFATEKIPFEFMMKRGTPVLKKLLISPTAEALQEFVEGRGLNFLEHFGYGAEDLDSVPDAVKDGLEHAMDDWMGDVVGGFGVGTIGAGVTSALQGKTSYSRKEFKEATGKDRSTLKERTEAFQADQAVASEADTTVVHTMPDGTTMPGPEHDGSVSGSERVVLPETPPAAPEAAVDQITQPATAQDPETPPDRIQQVEQRIQSLLAESEAEKDVDRLAEIADELDSLDSQAEALKDIQKQPLEQLPLKRLHQIAKKLGAKVPKGASKTRVINQLRGELLEGEAAKVGAKVSRLSDGTIRISTTEGNVTRATDFATETEAMAFLKAGAKPKAVRQPRLPAKEAAEVPVKPTPEPSPAAPVAERPAKVPKTTPKKPKAKEPTKPAKKVQPKKPVYGSKNKGVTTSEYEKLKAEIAEEAPLKGKRGKGVRKGAAAVFTAKDLARAAKIAAYHFEAGSRQFADWSARVLADLGSPIRPHLEKLWAQAKKDVEAFEGEKPAKAAPTEDLSTADTSAEVDEALDRLVSAKNVSMDEMRADLGLDAIPSAQRKKQQVSVDNAIRDGVPDRALRIAAEVQENPRQMTDEEEAGLLVRRVQLRDEYEGAQRKVKTTKDEAEISMLNAEMNRIEAEYDLLSQALRTAGTEIARALAFRRNFIDEKFDVLSVKTRARRAKGKDLTADESAKFEELVAKLNEANAEIDKLQAKLDEAAAENFVKDGGRGKRGRTKRTADITALGNRINELIKQGCLN